MDICGKIDDLYIYQLQNSRVKQVEVFQIEAIVLLWIDYLGLRVFILPENAQLLSRNDS